MLRKHHVAHHFVDGEQERSALTLGMWTFLVTEVMFFGAVFTIYSVFRFMHPEAFVAASHHLPIALGAFNTAVLIGSSLTMALAVRSAGMDQPRKTAWLLIATVLLGAVFLGVKSIEYADKWHHHLVPGPSFAYEGIHERGAELFFTCYFIMTGLHAFHMILGMPIIVVMAVMAWKGWFSHEWTAPVEMIGLYWHFVDIIWIFLFPLLYLLGLHL